MDGYYFGWENFDNVFGEEDKKQEEEELFKWTDKFNEDEEDKEPSKESEKPNKKNFKTNKFSKQNKKLLNAWEKEKDFVSKQKKLVKAALIRARPFRSKLIENEHINTNLKNIPEIISSVKQPKTNSVLNGPDTYVCGRGLNQRLHFRKACQDIKMPLDDLLDIAYQKRISGTNLSTAFGYKSHHKFPDQKLKQVNRCVNSIATYIAKTRACGGIPYNRTIKKPKEQDENTKQESQKIISTDKYNKQLTKERLKFLNASLKSLSYLTRSEALDNLFSSIKETDLTTKKNIQDVLDKWNNFFNTRNIVDQRIVNTSIHNLQRDNPVAYREYLKLIEQ